MPSLETIIGCGALQFVNLNYLRERFVYSSSTSLIKKSSSMVE